MEDRIHLCVMTSAGVKYEKIVHYAGLPLENGDAGILAGHTPLLAAVRDGPVKCEFGNMTEYVCVGNGVVDVFENSVTLLVRAAEAAQEIDLSRAEASERRARERIERKEPTTDMLRAKASLQRALAREKTYRLSSEKTPE